MSTLLPKNMIPLLVQSTILYITSLKGKNASYFKRINLAVTMLRGQLIWEFRFVKTNLDLV